MIDWHFLSGLEGGQRLVGYVPRSKDSDQSGVTIATGVDLGRYGKDALASLPKDLRAKLQPYIGLTGAMARQWLAKMPLNVTSEEADAIEAPVRAEMLAALTTHFRKDGGVAFDSLPDAVQTVLMSLTWQYGTPWVRTPHFWAVCCLRDWKGAVATLRDFDDAYPTRRNDEADYLKAALGI